MLNNPDPAFSPRAWERLDLLDAHIHELDKSVAVSAGQRIVQHEENQRQFGAQREENQRRFDALDVAMGSISTKQDLTNGNVVSLQQWRYFISGAVAVIVVILLPMAGYLAKLLIDKQFSGGH